MKQRVVRKINSRYDVACVKSNLFRLSKEIVRVAIERQLPNPANWHQLFGNKLSGIKKIKFELMLILLFNDLNTKFPLRVVAVFNCFPEITTMKVRILSGDLLSFIPDY